MFPIELNHHHPSPSEVAQIRAHDGVAVLDHLNLDRVILDPVYKPPLPGTSPFIAVRAAVAQALKRAAHSLPPGYQLVVMDGFRSKETQLAIFNRYLENLRKLQPELSEAELIQRTLVYIAHPGEHRETEVAPHNSGGAVDVRLKYGGREVNLGPGIERPGFYSGTDAFEGPYDPRSGVTEPQWSEIQANRRLIHWTMTSSGFAAYPHEWWHFERGGPTWQESGKTGWSFGSMEPALGALNITKCPKIY
jgi:D-alanyl-D-alanine dipeptidase